MKLKEAIYKMGKNSGIFVPDKSCYCEMELNGAGVVVSTSDKMPVCMSVENLNIEGEIIPAEPEVLSVDQLWKWFKPSYDKTAIMRLDFETLVGKCRLNFRLERDNELKKYVTKNTRAGSYIIKNWPPLNKDE